MHYLYGSIEGLKNAKRPKVFNKVTSKSGNSWYIPVDIANKADWLHVGDNNPNSQSQGYGGATLSFPLEDGSIDYQVGPWHSNADALYEDTGVDVRDLSFNFLAIGLKSLHKYNGNYCMCSTDDLIYRDAEVQLCNYDNYRKVIKEFANRFGSRLYYTHESVGGGSGGSVTPDLGIYIVPEKGKYTINISYMKEYSNGNKFEKFDTIGKFNKKEEAFEHAQLLMLKQYPNLNLIYVHEEPELL